MRREGRAQGLAYIYPLLDIDTLGELPDLAWAISSTFAEHFGFAGFNVTFPTSRRSFRCSMSLSEAAESARLGQHRGLATAGASATTPTGGASPRAFAQAWPDSSVGSVLLFGAGGAGAAVAHACWNAASRRC